VRTIETSWPFSAFGAQNLIPQGNRFANEIPSSAQPMSDTKPGQQKSAKEREALIRYNLLLIGSKLGCI
jgi:hypothetical protein